MENKLATVIQQKTVKKIFNQRSEFIIIGLIGSTGGSVSKIADLLARDFEAINLCEEPMEEKNIVEKLEYENVYRFAKNNWEKFDVIKVRDIIITYILENRDTYDYFQRDIGQDIFSSPEFQNKFYSAFSKKIQNVQNEHISVEVLKQEMEGFLAHCHQDGLFRGLLKKNQELLDYINVLRKKQGREYNIRKSLSLYIYTCYILPVVGNVIREMLKKEAYTTLFQKYGNQIRFFGTLDRKNWACRLEDVEEISNFDYFYSIAKRINTFIKIRRSPSTDKKSVPVRIVIDSLKNLYECNFLKERYSAYYTFTLFKRKETEENESSLYAEEKYNILYEMPNVIKKDFDRFVSLLIDQIEREHTLVRNDTFEYIKSMACADEFMKYLLSQLKKFEDVRATKEDIIAEVEMIPYTKEYERFGILEDKYKFYFKILNDPIRTFCMISGLFSFYLQDIQGATQNADVFLNDSENCYTENNLKYQIIKYVSLIMHPGLVPPTKIERCMQIAFCAKVNSGCISRQVGAVVTDKDYNILSIGWNDVPGDRVPCVYRNMMALKKNSSQEVYSDLERGESSVLFRNYIEQYDFSKTEKIIDVCEGIPLTYCFKSLYGKVIHERAQENSRAMHGEERAFHFCENKAAAQGGCLFTTSSSCERCTIIANEYKIKKIYYIEQYPGISQTHVNASGTKEGRAEFLMFQGAIGVAYTKLYTPVLPLKDELQLRGVDSLLFKEKFT